MTNWSLNVYSLISRGQWEYSNIWFLRFDFLHIFLAYIHTDNYPIEKGQELFHYGMT